MSKYTTEVRFICEVNSGLTESVGFDDVEKVIEKSAPKIFNFSFPMFDEDYRLPLEIKILRHYYTREICEETVGLWKLRLNARLNEIMPYYNQLYKSAQLEFDPFADTKIEKWHKLDGTRNGKANSNNLTTNNLTRTTEGSVVRTNDNNGNYTDNTENNNLRLHSDTPQGSVNFNEFTDSSAGGSTTKVYLTDVTNTKDNGQNTGFYEDHNGGSDITNDKRTDTGTVKVENGEQNHVKNDEEYWETVSGKVGISSYSKLLGEYRETFMNIDSMIISDLADLFFNLW